MRFTVEELKAIRKKQRKRNKKAGPIPPKLLRKKAFIKEHSKHLDPESPRHLNDWTEFVKHDWSNKKWIRYNLICACGQTCFVRKRRLR